MQSTYPEVPSTPCTLWEGAVQSSGYGSVTNGRGGSMLAHRKAWEAAHGPIPEGMTVDHLCCQKLCVNTEHFDIVTVGENVQRAIARKRETRRDEAGVLWCTRGHEQNEENVRVYTSSDGYVKTSCRACGREDGRAWYYAKKAAGEDPNAASKAARSARRRAAREAKAALVGAPDTI